MFLFSASFCPQKVAFAQVSIAPRVDTPACVPYWFKAANPSCSVISAEIGLLNVRIFCFERKKGREVTYSGCNE
jgi:hypothetical protein